MTTTTTVRPSPVQERFLAVPETFDVFLGGSRGSGKSHGIALFFLRAGEQYPGIRMLYVRQTHRGCLDFWMVLRDVLAAAYGSSVRLNESERIALLPNGSMIEVNQLATHGDLAKFLGRSFSIVAVDEVGEFASPVLVDRLGGCLRGPTAFPTRRLYGGNPGGPAHHWLARRWVLAAPAPWVPFVDETGRTVVYAPSTFRDNPHLDQAAYERQLRAACSDDPELLRAWADNDWSIARGAFFGAVLSEQRSALDATRWRAEAFRELRRSQREAWQPTIAFDFGTSAPCCALLLLESPGARGPDGHHYPPGSLLTVDELATHQPDDLTIGLQWPVPRIAAAIREELAERWGVPARGVADDACFSNVRGSGAATIADEFKRERVYFRPARKGSRVAGWTVMKRLLSDAGSPDRPGLYISKRCVYLWQTLPFLARDPRRMDDVDSRGADHGADALRYGCLRRGPMGGVVELGERLSSEEHVRALDRGPGLVV